MGLTKPVNLGPAEPWFLVAAICLTLFGALGRAIYRGDVVLLSRFAYEHDLDESGFLGYIEGNEACAKRGGYRIFRHPKGVRP